MRNRQVCGECGYDWTPRGRDYSIRCPNCGARCFPKSQTYHIGCLAGCLGSILLILTTIVGIPLALSLIKPDIPPRASIPRAPGKPLTELATEPDPDAAENKPAPPPEPEVPDLAIEPVELPDLTPPDVVLEPLTRTRTWKATSGHTTDARMIAVAEDRVKLEHSDGRTVIVSLDKLSDEDREYVKQNRAIAQRGSLLGVWYWNCPASNERNWWEIIVLVSRANGLIESVEKSVGHSTSPDNVKTTYFRSSNGRLEPITALNEDELMARRLDNDSGKLLRLRFDGSVDTTYHESPEAAAAAAGRNETGM